MFKLLFRVQGRSGLPTFWISAMILVALQNNSFINVLCNREYCLNVKFIFSVFIFPEIISTIQKESSLHPKTFCGNSAKLLRKKTKFKTCLVFGLWATQPSFWNFKKKSQLSSEERRPNQLIVSEFINIENLFVLGEH